MLREITAQGTKLALGIAAALTVAMAPAQADLKISSNPTQNVSCDAAAHCSATAPAAAMNVHELKKLLASQPKVVLDAATARDIDLDAPVSWTSSSNLSLVASRSVLVHKSLTVAGPGGLRLKGELLLTPGTSITFWNLSSSLNLNGNTYQLAGSLSSLNNAIKSSPAGYYALANDYDASADGVYANTPIEGDFTGAFEGLGHTISHVALYAYGPENGFLGLFSVNHGTIADINLIGAKYRNGVRFDAGILVGDNYGTIRNASVTGSVNNVQGALAVGGLVGGNGIGGVIVASRAVARVEGDPSAVFAVGGLVGLNWGMIEESYAEGSVSMDTSNSPAGPGGLAGVNGGVIKNCYSLAHVHGVAGYYGGLIGGAGAGSVAASYAAGQIEKASRSGGLPGGITGYQPLRRIQKYSDTYWDVDDGVRDRAGAVGSVPNHQGVTGLTTLQLQSGLPAGFDSRVWVQNPNINNGLPYLLHSPPP
jgi:The GLUG motif